MLIKSIDNLGKWTENKLFFTQSWKWGDILLSEGCKISRLVVLENEEIIAFAQVIYQNLPFGLKYAFCPKGPHIDKEFKDRTGDILRKIGDYLKKEGCIFFRFEPKSFFHIKKIKYNLLKTKDINPKATLILNLLKPESELLSGMHHKTRYNIRLANKKNLKVIDQKDISGFLKLSEKTASRDNFSLHNIKHYKEVLNSEISYMFSVVCDEELIAVAIFVGSGDTFTYLYGASDYKHREKMAPYFLQWEGIKLGKRLGYKYYDFFGVAPNINKNLKDIKKDYKYNPKHQYSGVSRFKIGFGGKYNESVGTYDLVFSNYKYNCYKILRKIRKILKHFL